MSDVVRVVGSTAMGALGGLAFGNPILGAFIGFATAVASTAIESAMKPDSPNFEEAAARGNEINVRSTQEDIKIVYGKGKVGGNDVFVEVNGQTLWIVQSLAEGECNGVYNSEVYLDDKLYGTYGGNVTYYFHSGSASQTYDTNLNSAISKWTDNLRNTCYIVYSLNWNRNYFNSVPQRTVVLEGKKLYDFRTGTTAYSTNPVLALYDYLTNTRYGVGVSSTTIDLASWTSAANYCTTKGWNINLVISDSEAAFDIIENITKLFRGQLVWYDGKYYLRYADLNYESSVMTITDSQIVQDSSGKAQISISQPSKFGKPDGIKVTFVDPQKSYAVDNIQVGETLGVIDELSMIGATDRTHASNLGIYYLERKNLDRTISGVFRDDCLKLEPHDIVTFNSTALGISNQLMRVVSSNIAPSGLIQLSLMYEAASLYDDDYDADVTSVYTCSLPDRNETINTVSNVTISEEQYNYRLQTFTRLLIGFEEPDNYIWFSHVEVWRAFSDDSGAPDWTVSTSYTANTDIIFNGGVSYLCISTHTSASTNEPGVGVNWKTYWVKVWEHLFNTTNDFSIDPVEEGVTYHLRLKTVNIFGGKTTDQNDYHVSKTVLGYVSTPSSLTTLEAIVNANAINLYSYKISDPDIELYEFRLGAGWSSGIFIGAYRSPNLSLNGVKPGDYTFYCNTLSTNGLYGTNAQFASASLIDPPDGWTVQEIEYDDYISNCSNGTFTTDTAWTKGTGWTVDAADSNVAHSDGSQTGASDLYQDANFYEGREYEITYTVSNRSAGSVAAYVGATGNGTSRSTNGTFTEKITCAGTPAGRLYIKADADFVGDIDNVIIRSGTHNNTERISYGGDYYLKCSHTAGVLTGTYTSPVYNLGTSSRRLVYSLADVLVIGEGTSWDDQYPLVLTGSELLTNNGFSAYTADELDNWTEVDCDTSEDVSGETGSAVKLTLSADAGYIHQSISVTAGLWYKINFYYKNTTGDTATIGVYDVTNSSWISPDGTIDLTSNTSNFTVSSYLFQAPTGCSSVSIRFGGKTNGDIVWFDTASIKQIDTSASATWDSASSSTRTWQSIFELGAAPSLQMKLNYGVSSVSENTVEKMEILSAIVTAQYFQLEITITDPSPKVYAYLSNYQLKFCS